MHSRASAQGERPAPSQLVALGWSEWFETRFAPYRDQGFQPGRVVVDYGAACAVATATGDVLASMTGRLRGERASTSRPAVGDWLVLRQYAEGRASIRAVLERRISLSRKVALAVTEEQVLAANVDRVFIVSTLTEDLNLRRLERYLTVAWESGAPAEIILTKADLSERRHPRCAPSRRLPEACRSWWPAASPARASIKSAGDSPRG
jgi:ribosome biogenesis GTPase